MTIPLKTVMLGENIHVRISSITIIHPSKIKKKGKCGGKKGDLEFEYTNCKVQKPP